MNKKATVQSLLYLKDPLSTGIVDLLIGHLNAIRHLQLKL